MKSLIVIITAVVLSACSTTGAPNANVTAEKMARRTAEACGNKPAAVSVTPDSRVYGCLDAHGTFAALRY